MDNLPIGTWAMQFGDDKNVKILSKWEVVMFLLC